tara:strand:+ start:9460 stop:10590 length:1131 start_codon:yes stop_codon:yes gene_type:complete
MLGKVSNIFKSAVTNMIGNSISSAISGFASQGQTAKIAAKLLNKSPLEIGSANVPPQTGHMALNPFEYGQIYYPETTSQLGEGHYMIFDVVEVDPEKFKNTGLVTQNDPDYKKLVGENVFDVDLNVGSPLGTGPGSRKKIKGLDGDRLRKTTSGFQSTRPTHTRISNSIVLYTPAQGLETNYSVNYEAVETGLIGFLAERGASNFIEGLSTSGGEIVRGFVDTVSSALGAGGLRAVLDKSKARAKNPKKEQIFRDVPFREFNFAYEFYPRNEREQENVHKIIELFKFHMHPQIAPNRYFVVPSEFQITYMYRDKANLWFPKISRCVLKDMKVNYAPDGVVTTFKENDRGAAPVGITISLSFAEIEIMTKNTIAQGY